MDSRYYVVATFDDGEFMPQHFGYVDAVVGLGVMLLVLPIIFHYCRKKFIKRESKRFL